MLCRKRESLRLVADGAARAHVPYAAAEESRCSTRPRRATWSRCSTCWRRRSTELSLARALRSPLFGASDDDLLAPRARRGARAPRLVARAAARCRAGPALARARDAAAALARAAQRLPPHDLLDRIVAEGDVRARVAAAVPPEQRAAALGAIDALLAQALMLDGGRYATPCRFVGPRME